MKNYLLPILVFLMFSCGKDDSNSPVITKENNAPTIEAQGFDAKEDISDTVIIGTVKAQDLDEDDELTFSITQNDNELFEITESGDLSLLEGKKLSYEDQSYSIIVSVSDSKANSSETITITVLEKDNSAPVIVTNEFEIEENVPDTQLIGTVVATDENEDPLVFSLVENDNDLFQISENGELRLAPGKTLNYLLNQNHQITIAVTDGSASTQSSLTVRLIQVYQNLQNDPRSFITQWDITENGYQLIIGTNPDYQYDFIIDWGDGNVEKLNQGNPSHQYDTADTYNIAIQGHFPAIQMTEAAQIHRESLLGIEQWGSINWSSFYSAFNSCPNLEYHASDTPNLTHVESLQAMFAGASSFNADLNEWDLSNVTNISGMFEAAYSFNGNISNWDVSNVTNMAIVFSHAIAFDGNISKWEVDQVKNMEGMFYGATLFNGDLSSWNVENVTSMRNMFHDAIAFEGIGLENWTVQKVGSMYKMFYEAEKFNASIGNWNVSNVGTMFFMFYASAFDQNLSEWDINNCFHLEGMFNDSAMSKENYSATLIGWGDPFDPDVKTYRQLGANGLSFCNNQEVLDARDFLINTMFWSIGGDTGVDCN